MSVWMLNDDQYQLILAVCEGAHDEQALAEKLKWSPQQVTDIVRSLINPIPGCPYGLVNARLSRIGSSPIEHARDIKLTPLGQQVCKNKSKNIQYP